MKWIRKVLLPLVCIVLFSSSVWGIDINYPDFSDLTGLTLTLEANYLTPNEDNRLSLVTGTGYGCAYLSDPINISAGFSTQYSFQITNLYGVGADWLWFMVSKVPFELMNANVDTVIVEVDIFNNGARDNNNGNHLALGYNTGLEFAWFEIAPVSQSFKNGEVWNVWIDYDGSVMNVYASMGSQKPETPYISHSFNLIDKIGGVSEAYIGFQAGAGGHGADFDVLRWTLSTPLPIPITIDIKPGSFPNSINLKSKGVVPVAILTTPEFDASTVDPTTVRFAGASLVKRTMEDADHDGDLDLLLHFNTQELNLDGNSTEATLTGTTYDGLEIVGTDSVNIVPKSKK